MARPPSATVAARNHEIYSLWQHGSSLTELADQFKLSPQRIGQVVASYHPEDDEDIDRSLYRGYLWRLFEEIRELYRNPGWKMSPTGGPARDPDGDPALDTNVRLQAGELELKILESLRRMDARDRPQVKKFQFERSEAEQKMWAEIEAERRKIAQGERPAVIPGEVVRELGPVQQREE